MTLWLMVLTCVVAVLAYREVRRPQIEAQRFDAELQRLATERGIVQRTLCAAQKTVETITGAAASMVVALREGSRVLDALSPQEAEQARTERVADPEHRTAPCLLIGFDGKKEESFVRVRADGVPPPATRPKGAESRSFYRLTGKDGRGRWTYAQRA